MTSKQFYWNYKIQVYIIIYKGLGTFSTYFKLAKIAFDNFIYDYGDLKDSVWSVSTNYKFSRRLAINWKYQKFWCRFTKSHESELWIWLFINSTWSCTGSYLLRVFSLSRIWIHCVQDELLIPLKSHQTCISVEK